MNMQVRVHTRREILGLVLLVFVTAAWGSTFLLVKNVTRTMPVMGFLALRFWIASFVLVLLRPRSLLRISSRTLMHGAVLGLALSGGYIFQTLGLRYTSAALSGFLTGLCVIITPIIAWPMLHHRASTSTIVAVIVATLGLGVLSMTGISFGLGEGYSIFGAICYALQIVGLGAWSEGEEIYALAFFQLLTVSVVCTLGSAPHFSIIAHGALAWFGVISTAVIATSLAFVVQAWAQSYISPTRAAIVFTLEPVFAGLVAWFGGEHLSGPVISGGALIVGAMLIAELGLRYHIRLGRLTKRADSHLR
ncbi:MAG TPA: DMT family transporter [Acidimicrobiales bacterium]|nr:DMT family transporter [Acidimicrobiales bacterium]